MSMHKVLLLNIKLKILLAVSFVLPASWLRLPVAFVLVLSGACCGVAIAEPVALRLNTHEQFLKWQRGPGDFDISNLSSVFAAVFRGLPREVNVWPTGNYYFFSFQAEGRDWRGNFRLDVVDRDAGAIHFAIHGAAGGGEPGRSVSENSTIGRAFGAKDGVKVTAVARFVYVVQFEGRAVVFRLNAQTGRAPGDVTLRGGETYLGPIFDESGYGFFLIWDPEALTFLYILDEDHLPEPLEPSPISAQVRIGQNSGFAFYRDRYRPRWILVGVRAQDVVHNSFFDGPFDQLPDNVLQGSKLRRALTVVHPELTYHIDRYGNSPDLKARVLVRPYILYSEILQLSRYDGCAARAGHEKAYYRCFSARQRTHKRSSEPGQELGDDT